VALPECHTDRSRPLDPAVSDEGDTRDVASHRLKRIVRGTFAVAAVIAVVSFAPAAATAAPTPPPPPNNDPVAQFTQLSQQANALNEKIDAANVDLTNKQALAQKAGNDVAAAKQAEQAAQDRVNTYLVQVDQFSGASYEGARFNQLSALLTGTSARDYLNRATDLQALATDNFDAMNRLGAAVDAAHQAETRAQNDLRTAQDATAAATALKAQLVQQGQALQAQLAPLIAARNRLSAQQQATLATTGVQGVFIAPPGVRGAAMTIALAQRGKPYLWAGAGPGNFDCSGLVLYAYAQAGMSGLPHSAAAQAAMGVPVARADLQAGDLVFFDSPIGHVGIYVGNGLMVDAAHFGTVVRVEPLFPGYAGARRLGL
jgi:cell wall-associated NlpC family hydrolase